MKKKPHGFCVCTILTSISNSSEMRMVLGEVQKLLVEAPFPWGETSFSASDLNVDEKYFDLADMIFIL